MKKILTAMIMMLIIQTLRAQSINPPMIGKSKASVMATLYKEKGLYSCGYTTQANMDYNKTLVNSPFVNEVWYNISYKPKGLYAFEAHFVHYFNEYNICTGLIISIPGGYLRYMMASLKGYKQVDNTNFISYNGKTDLQLDVDPDNGKYRMTFTSDPNSPKAENVPIATKPIFQKNFPYNKLISAKMIQTFGNYDYKSQTSTWFSKDESVLKTFSEITTSNKFTCKTKFADSLTLNNKKTLVILVEINPSTGNDYHASAPILRFLTFCKQGSSWVPTKKHFDTQMGSYGEIPKFEIKNLGQNTAFLFTPGYTSGGETEESMEMYGFFDGNFKEFLNIQDFYDDNSGACDSTKLNSCYMYEGKIHIQADNKVFNDIIFSKKGTMIQNRQLVKIDSTISYEFVNGAYIKKKL